MDGWIESGLESAGESAVGAKVEIDNLHVSLSPIGIKIEKLQVANPQNPWKNIFETGRIQFALNFGQLLRNKYIIETMEVNNFILGTKRTTSGALPPKPKPKNEEPSFADELMKVIEKKAQEAPVFDIEQIKKNLKIDSLLNPNNIKTVQYYDSAKIQIANLQQEWESTQKEYEKTTIAAQEIETQIRSINIDELKTIDKLTDAANTVNTSYKKIQEMSGSIATRSQSVKKQITTTETMLANVDDIIKEDYERIMRLAKLPDLSMKGISKLLIGDKLLNEANYYLHWIDVGRKYIPQSSKTEEKKPERMKGINIHFPEERSYPKLWIKKILISGGTDKKQDSNYIYAKGEVKNITNDQRITKLPLTITLDADNGNTMFYNISALFDRRKEEPFDEYKASVKGISIASMEIGSPTFLPTTMKKAKADVSVDIAIPGKNFDANATVNFKEIELVFQREVKNPVERIVKDVVSPINKFDAKLRMWNTSGNFDVAFVTDLDDQIAVQAKRVLAAELEKIRREIEAKLNAYITEKKQEAEKLLNAKKEEITKQISAYEKTITDAVGGTEGKTKEIEKRIEEEKNKLGDDAKKKMEDALKKKIKI